MRPSKALLLLLAAAAVACGRKEEVVSTAAPNAPVIIISVDTLRADRLPAYGYRAVQTPAIDALRRDGILFSNAYSHVPLTLPSHVSILTGLLPPQHGVRDNVGFRLDAKHATIPTLLKSRGYTTGAAVSAYVLRGDTGLRPAFDFFDEPVGSASAASLAGIERRGEETVAIAEKWISERASQPFFFLLHLFEPHAPYDPPEPYRSRFASRYDGEIAATDQLIDRFVATLRRLGVYDRAVIILLSDHGEGLGEHGEREHGIFVYRESIQVPLILKLPKQAMANTIVSVPAQLTDVLPTITALTGIEAPANAGRSLLDIARTPPRRIYSESFYGRMHLGWSELRSLIDDRFHFIEAPQAELYATGDVAERKNVIADHRRVATEMRTELKAFEGDVPQMGAIDPEEAKKLAALGYLTSVAAQTGPLPDPKERIGDLTMMDEIASLEAAGDRDAAIARTRQLLSRNPKMADAWSLLGRLLQESGRLQDASEAYRQGIRAAPAVAPELALSVAGVELMLGRYDEAAAHAALGAEILPGLAHLILGRVALAKNDLAGAAREAAAALESPAQRPDALVLQAEIAARSRRLEDALALTDRALDAARQAQLEAPPLLYFVRAEALVRMNRPDEAIAAFEQELRLYPHDRQAYASLAVVHLLLGRPAAANATMERLVAANPDRASYELAAATFEHMRDPRSAAEWRRRAANIAQ